MRVYRKDSPSALRRFLWSLSPVLGKWATDVKPSSIDMLEKAPGKEITSAK